MHAGQIGPGGTGVIAGALARQRIALLVRQAGDHHQAVAVRGQRLEQRREGGRQQVALRRPALHPDPVGHIDDAEALDWREDAAPAGSKRRHHAVEQRQRDRGPEATEEGSPRQRFSRDHHDSDDLRIWNG
jgi:hypothetical protein